MSSYASDLEYRPLSEPCDVDAFNCGVNDIDKWFRKRAADQHKSHVCKVTTAHLPGVERPVGFYAISLILEEDRLLAKQDPLRARLRSRVYPALHLEYLAVDKEFTGGGIGSNMLIRAIETFRVAVMDMGLPVFTAGPIE